jgi:hypothetical protein
MYRTAVRAKFFVSADAALVPPLEDEDEEVGEDCVDDEVVVL